MEPHTPKTATARPSKNTDTPAAKKEPGDAGRLGAARAHRPVHLHPRFVLVVITGGVFGAWSRYGLSTVLPSPGGWPLPTLIINVTGALMLGALLEALVRRGPDAGRRRMIRLLAGTGFMGAFTTYSTLALEADTLIGADRAVDAVVYVAATLLGGAVATVAGIRAAAAHHRRMSARRGNETLRPDGQEGSR
jgi:fluoride exporter